MRRPSLRLGLTSLLVATAMALASCTAVDFTIKDIRSRLGTVDVTMSTYDAQGHPIDRITGSSFSVNRDSRFDSVDSEGVSAKDSSVLSITLGGGEINHVGSAMVVAEEGLEDAAAEFPEKVGFAADDRSVPFIDRFVHDIRNQWAPKSRVVLIRSQQGHPVAVFTGDTVAMGSTDIPKSTALLVDGKLLILYRVDYTIYDTKLLN